MPTYDYQCDCGARFELLTRVSDRDHVVCNNCGLFAGRIWTKMAAVHPDSIPGGMTIENLSAQPQTFYSKSEYRDAMRAANVVNVVRHQPPPGTDKSKFTTRWI